ncbi:MAG TPA: hypothetical protein VLE89_08385 [Chlamydiales bacterium]|nr:hypothetical protein [Chlamydiales bacterium]
MKYFLLLLSPFLWSQVNLEENPQSFILETKRIELPEFPDAFNPSIARWQEYFLLSFRVIPDPKTPFISYIGVVLLDDNFDPIVEPQLLQTRPHSSIPSRAADARLIPIGKSLYIIYTDNVDEKVTAGGYRMYIGELIYDNNAFSIHNPMHLHQFEGENPTRKEQNWVPFVYQGHLLLAYSLTPHLIFHPLPQSDECETIASTHAPIHWPFGPLHGGTPALPLDTDHYLSFFHSWKKMATSHSNGIEMPHYFMGAYLFSSTPPFQITHISLEPIIAPGFYSGAIYKPYWGALRCIFPSGFLFDDQYIWILYGRQDHEIWLMKLDRPALLHSLTPIKEN